VFLSIPSLMFLNTGSSAFADDDGLGVARRRAAAFRPGEKALLAELPAMNARM